MKVENYFYGAGVSSFVEIDATTGRATGRIIRVGNADGVKVSMKVERKEKRESMSGQNALVRSKVVQVGGELAVTLSEGRRGNLEMFLFGKTVEQAAVNDYVMSDAIPNAAEVGSEWLLDHQKVSNLVIKDNAAATVDASKYEYDEVYGTVKVLASLGTGPFDITYDAEAVKVIPVFQHRGKQYLYRHEGMNTGNDEDEAFLIEFYKVELDPVSDLDLITDDFGKFELKGTLVADPRRASDPNFGKFGRHVDLTD